MIDPTIDILKTLFLRELDGLIDEIEAYPDDDALWKKAPAIENPGGTLALHLAGNLRHFVGASMAGSDYTRDRKAEFSRTDLTRSEVAGTIRAAREEVARALGSMTEADLELSAPLHGFEPPPGRRRFLIHLLSHLAYHLGQVDYHRRFVSGGGGAVGVLDLRRMQR